MVRFPQKAKTPIVKGVEEDREVTVGTTYVGGVRAVTITKEEAKSCSWIF
jgi:hypothetical protein